MKMRKNNLDEMQEKKLLQIEHSGFWIAFWGLVVAIMIQTALGNDCIGEIVILSVVSIYTMIACIQNGIWDRKFKPNLKTNLLMSGLTGVVFGGFWFGVSYYRYHVLLGSIATFAFMLIFSSLLCLAVLTITSGIYKKRKHKLDAEADKDENED